MLTKTCVGHPNAALRAVEVNGMDRVVSILVGDLTAEERVWSALAPAVALVAYFIIGLMIYPIRVAFKGPYRDPELEKRDATILTGVWIRLYFVWVTQPLWRFVLRTGIPATAVTTLSVLLACGSGIALASGRFALGGWLYIFSGICDFLDGRLARAHGSSGPTGAALDSVLDRVSDSVVLVGLGWFYRDTWVLAAVLAALVGSSLVPYIRARGEIVGITMTVGLMQRAERILYLGTSVCLSPIFAVWWDDNGPKPFHHLAVFGIVLMAVSTLLTAFHRLVYLLRALHSKSAAADARPPLGRTLLRNICASVLATGIDFAFVWVLVHEGVSAPLATGLGCVLGGVVNFTINRMWTFQSRGAKVQQIPRYAFVSVTSALLNSGGVALMLLLPTIDFRIAWILVRASVYLGWNFPLHRDYVFVSTPPNR